MAQGAIDFGSEWAGAPWELLRTLFSFTVGVVLFRARARLAIARTDSRLGWLPLAVLPLPFLAAPADRAWWDLLCVLLIFPALIWFGANWDLSRSRIAAALGDISYPFYCIHWPLIIVGFQAGIDLNVLLVMLVLAAWAIDRWYDRPARAWLAGIAKRARLRRPAPA